jgi:hypothetical protein
MTIVMRLVNPSLYPADLDPQWRPIFLPDDIEVGSGIAFRMSVDAWKALGQPDHITINITTEES